MARNFFFFLLSFLQRRGQSACRGRTDLLRWPTNKEIKYTLAHQGQQNEYNFSQDICPSNFANHCIRVSKIYHNLLIVAPIISELRLFLQLSWILWDCSATLFLFTLFCVFDFFFLFFSYFRFFNPFFGFHTLLLCTEYRSLNSNTTYIMLINRLAATRDLFLLRQSFNTFTGFRNVFE